MVCLTVDAVLQEEEVTRVQESVQAVQWYAAFKRTTCLHYEALATHLSIENP